jgi:hypothetical protein
MTDSHVNDPISRTALLGSLHEERSTQHRRNSARERQVQEDMMLVKAQPSLVELSQDYLDDIIKKVEAECAEHGESDTHHVLNALRDAIVGSTVASVELARLTAVIEEVRGECNNTLASRITNRSDYGEGLKEQAKWVLEILSKVSPSSDVRPELNHDVVCDQYPDTPHRWTNRCAAWRLADDDYETLVLTGQAPPKGATRDGWVAAEPGVMPSPKFRWDGYAKPHGEWVYVGNRS